MTAQPKPHRSTIQPANWSIEQLPGMRTQEQSLLEELGITSTNQLLKVASSPQSKQTLANQLQIKVQNVDKWVALADLARIPSIGCQYCGLLLHAGIGSVVQLAQTSTQRLHQQILRLQVATMQRRDLCPGVEEIAVWIKQAQALAIRY
ncbi:MAG: DUF4332 domain-containing protein [Symploca sp. SIO2G7]|nr:DUF4332 domain-containing protein [Symploca sp. SIO2G7]